MWRPMTFGLYKSALGPWGTSALILTRKRALSYSGSSPPGYVQGSKYLIGQPYIRPGLTRYFTRRQVESGFSTRYFLAPHRLLSRYA